MRTQLLSTVLALISVAIGLRPMTASAAESTMPPQYAESISATLGAQYNYIENGDYTKKLGIPTYEWLPADHEPKAVILAVHGLTLHGRRFRVLARSLAVNDVAFIALDMRGFGSSYFDQKKQFSTEQDDRTGINHEKSYEEIVQLAKLIKEKYPNQPLIALGESLGCSFCVRLAADQPDLITAIILSAPAVKVNKDMYVGKGQIRQGLKSLIAADHEMDLSSFFAELCSGRPLVQNEMLDDPYIRKRISIRKLLATDLFVDHTVLWAKKTDPKLSVLILQGGSDGCVSAKHVTDLMNGMPSVDQNLAWRGHFGHLQLETIYMRAPMIDAIGDWLIDHGREGKKQLQELEQTIASLGGHVSN